MKNNSYKDRAYMNKWQRNIQRGLLPIFYNHNKLKEQVIMQYRAFEKLITSITKEVKK